MAKYRPIKTKERADALREMLRLFGVDSGKALGRVLGLSASSSRGCVLLRDLTQLSLEQVEAILDVFDDKYEGLSDSDKLRFQELSDSDVFPDGREAAMELLARESKKNVISHAANNLSDKGLETLYEVAAALLCRERS